MKRFLIGMVAVVFTAGLALAIGAEAAYRTEATVTPSDTAHQYVVQFKITKVGKDGKTDVLSTPKLEVKAGTEADIHVGDDQLQSGVFCTAIVREVADGVEAVTTVTIKEKGTEKLSTSQRMTVKK